MHIQSIYLKTMVDLLHVKEKSNRDPREQLGLKSVELCDTTGRGKQTVVSELERTLIKSHCPFAYYMLVAFEAGSPFRGLVLLLLWPVIWALQILAWEAVSVQMLIFISTVGLRETDLEGVGRAVLCKFYVEDMHPHAYQVFLACGRRCVVTSSPRVMVEPFLKEYLEVELVLGSELHTVKGFCTGLLKGPGVLVGDRQRDAVKNALQMPPDLGLGSVNDYSGFSFLSLCKEAYVVPTTQAAVAREDYIKPLIFHDGRLAIRPTPITALFIYLWFPMGLVLSILRLFLWVLLPVELATPLGAFLGVRVRIRGAPPLLPQEENGSSGTRGSLYVCTHRTLLDPIFLSVGLRRRVAAVTYSLSKVSETLSPLKTVTLSRKREEDACIIQSVLKHGDLVICPEGTTCREPYLLRFSPLFAEMTNDIVPVGMHASMSLFYGTTASGFKGMDPFYFLMNPFPTYTVTILDPLPKEQTCASGKSSVDVANHLQKLMGSVMGYQCTNLSRKDKYHILAGNDGLVPSSKTSASSVIKRTFTTISKTSKSHLASENLAMFGSLWLSLCKCFSPKQAG